MTFPRTKTDNHFISVSRDGVLIARRKGNAPVKIATAENGIAVLPDEAAIALGVPTPLQVYFGHGGTNRNVLVLELAGAGRRWPVADFLREFPTIEASLGRWLRAAVEQAMDREPARPSTT